MKNLILMISIPVLLSYATIATAQSCHKKKSQDIVGIATSSHDFSTLVAALKAADLVSALQSDGPFTVFAPTNAAFSKIDSNTLNSLLEPKNKKQLTSILTYHVIKGKLTAADVVEALEKGKGEVELTTLSGAKLKAIKNDEGILLRDQNGAYSHIEKTDLLASNGVIHVIDSVVMPK